MCFVEFFMRKSRIHTEGMIFSADTSNESGDQSPAGDVIDHGVLFGHRERIGAQRQRTAQNRDLGLGGAARQRRGGHYRRRHDAVSGLVMFVDAKTVKTEFFAVLQLIQITVVEQMAFFGIVEAVGQGHPGRLVILGCLHIEVGIGHQMK